MARAFICLARNDLDDNLLQDLGLLPNTSQYNPPYDPVPQTGYLTWFPQNDTVATTVGGGGIRNTDADYYGLAAYILDRVEDTTGGAITMADADAGTIAAGILTRVAAGNTLQLADINAVIVATLGAGNDLEGTAGASFGTVDEVLQILSGVSFKIPAGAQVADAANAFPGAPGQGFFTTAPNVVEPLLHPGGRKGTEPLTTRTPVQTPPQDLGHRFIRRTEDTSDLHRSALDGRFELMAAATYAFANPNFTYGTGGTAQTVAGVAIGTDHAARAVTVYAADGTVII